MARELLEFVDVSKSMKGRLLYAGLNFAVASGTVFGVSGPNGSGKSVLLRIACGLMQPDRGAVQFASALKPAGADFPMDVGLAIDGQSFIAGLTAFDNLSELARIRRIIDDGDVRDILTSFDLDPNSRMKARRFSLGMKQKLTLAQAFMEKPRLLVLDEPFNALDAASADRLSERIREHRNGGGSVVLVSHDRDLMRSLCDEELVLDGVGGFVVNR